MKNKFVKMVLPLMGCVLVTSCGSGSSGSGVTAVTGTVTPPAPTPTNYNTAEYRRSYALGQMKAIAAYDNGATGQGVTVAVIDSGIDIDSAQLVPNIHSDSINIATNSKDDLNDTDGHGTAVASVIASIRDPFNTQLEQTNRNTHGVAFDSKVLALNAASVGSCASTDGCSFFDSDVARALDYARVRGVKVVNISLGGDDFNSPSLVEAYKRAVAAGMVIIVAAGNKEDQDTDVTLAKPENSASVAWSSWANGQIIVAGAVDQSTTIAEFSHRAGAVAKDVYLVAGGDRILTLGTDGDYYYYSGTSFSAPHISGAAALLFSAFPNLTGKEVADLLFESATDLGDIGADNIYGRGLVNIEEAFKPKGSRSIAVRSAAGDITAVDVNNTALLGGGAFGSFAGFSQAVNNSMMLDDYNRSYRIDLGQRIFNRHESVKLESLIESRKGSRESKLHLDQAVNVKFSWREDWRFHDVEEHYFSHQLKSKNRYHDLRMNLGLTLSPTQKMSFAQGLSLKETLEDYDQDDFLTIGKEDFLALVGRTNSQTLGFQQKMGRTTQFSLAMGHGQREWQQYGVKSDHFLMMTRITHQVSDSLDVGGDFGLLSEKGSLLGSLSLGAISLGEGATTAFVNGRLNLALSERVNVTGRASYGRTAVKGADVSLVENIDGLASTSFSLTLTGNSLFQKGDRLSFAISQPLRVVRGVADLAYVSARNYQDDSLTFTNQQISLSPQGREIDFELAYRMGNFFGAEVDLNFLHQLNPNHDNTLPNNSGFLIRFGSEF